MTPRELLELIRSYGFHISDGIDSCSGHDEQEEKDAILEIYAKICNEFKIDPTKIKK